MNNAIDSSRKLSFASSNVIIGELQKHTTKQLEHDIDRMLTAPAETAYRESELTYIYVDTLLCMLTSQSTLFVPATLVNLKADIATLLPPDYERPLGSTPNVRIFVNGSFRAWGKDDVPDGLHFVAVVATPAKHGNGVPAFDLEIPPSQKRESGQELPRVIKIDLSPGRTIIHSTACQYRISTDCSSANPREGLIVVDGYIW
jgi:hypothetical protein